MTTITEFGSNVRGRVSAVTLENRNGMRASVLSYGATLQSLQVPDKNGALTDVVLGYDSAEEYAANSGYLGATVGRNANRIAGAAFTLNGTRYRLTANENRSQLHGGFLGLDKKIWSCACRDGWAEFSAVLEDGEEGFPGRMTVCVRFSLEDDNSLRIDYRAVCDADTVANFTNHAYFNLNGQGSGPIWNHTLQIGADRFTPADAETLPTGELRSVAGTCMDFRTAKPIGRDRGDALLGGVGYDHNLCLNGSGLRLAAQARGDVSGIRMRVYTTMEGLQLYTGNYLSRRAGKAGTVYEPYGGFCMETQRYPDAINQPAFPSPVLRRGEEYRETTIWRFDGGEDET